MKRTEKRLKKPIFIVGAPRSGTTFLANALSKHSKVAYAVEPSAVWRFGNEKRSDLLRPEWITPKTQRHIVSYFQNYLEEQKAERLLEKTPQNSLRMPFLDKIFPDAVYVHIIRNGMESVLSIRDRWGSHTKGLGKIKFRRRLRQTTIGQLPYYGIQVAKRVFANFSDKPAVNWGPLLPGISEMRHECGALWTAAYQWRFCVEMAASYGRKLEKERYMEVRLEELDEGRFLDVLSFIGLDGEKGVTDAFNESFKADRVTYREQRASIEDKEIIASLLQPTETWLNVTTNY